MSQRRNRPIASKILDAIDMFNASAHLNLRGKRVLSTVLGGIATICLAMFITSQISIQYYAMVNKQNPQVFQSNELESNPTAVELNLVNNFFLAITITANSAPMNLSQASPFDFKTTFNKYSILEDGTKFKVKYPVLWAPCNNSDFPPKLYGPLTFNLTGLSYGFCANGINFTNSTDGSCPEDISKNYASCIAPPDFAIRGDYFSEQFDFIQSNVVICDPNDPTLPYGMVCNNTGIAKRFAKDAFKLNLYYSYSLINSADYAHPNKTLLDNIYWNINPKISKVANIFVDRITVQDFDDDLYINKYKNQTFYSSPATQVRNLETVETGSASILLQWNMRRSLQNKVIIRTYATITEILTNLGGFTTFLMFVAGTLIIGYVRYRYHMMISNDLYHYKFPSKPTSPPKPEKKSKKKGQHVLMVSRDNSNVNVSVNMSASGNAILLPDTILSSGSPQLSAFASPRMDPLMTNKNVNEYIENLQQKDKKLKFTVFHYFKFLFHFCCCRKNYEEQLGTKARRLASQDLDILALFRKLQEFDRLKLLLLTARQRDAFHFIEKPLVALHSKKALRSDSLTNYSRLMMKSSTISHNGLSRNVISLTEEKNKLIQNIQEKNQDKSAMTLATHSKLYEAYRYLLDDHNSENAIINKKLINSINRDLMKVFKRVDQIVGEDDPSENQFSDIIKQIADNPNALLLSK